MDRDKRGGEPDGASETASAGQASPGFAEALPRFIPGL
jgi:hypothetical protein